VPESKPEVRLTKIDANATKLELLLRVNNPAKANLISSDVLKKIKQKLESPQEQ